MYAATRSFCSAGVARALCRDALPRTKYASAFIKARPTKHSNNVSFPRYFSSTSVRHQKPIIEAASATVAQSSPSAVPPVGDAVDYNVMEDVASIYEGDYLPHNTQIYSDYLILEQTQAEKASQIVDVTSGSEITMSQIAEGLSTDILAASGIVPTLHDMGLGSYYTPAGLLQNCLDLLHNAGAPWWITIAATTFVIKSLMVPIVIKSQRNATNMNNHMPEMQRLQVRMTEARRSGNMLEASKAGNDLAVFMAEKNMNIFKGFAPMLIQAPIFISFFVGLRGMANLPIESMKTGGIYWFTDLTVPDPLYILPLITCASVLIMFETGADGSLPSDNLRNMKYVMRAIPIVMFPFVMSFPAAILCYWSTSNLFSLVQTVILRRPAVRKRFNIPERIKHKKEDLPMSKGFVKDMKDNYQNAMLSNEIGNRARSDEIRFKKAGLGPVVKTFKHPQKLRHSANN